jgi:hypothetical protein
MRVFLVIAGCLLALLLMAAAGGYWWWQNNGEALIGAASDGMRDGARQGEAGSARDCHDLGLQGLQRCRSFDCGIYNRAYAVSCFQHTRSDAGLCETLPRSPGIIESMQWISARCADVTAESSACQGLMQATLDYCARDDR